MIMASMRNWLNGDDIDPAGERKTGHKDKAADQIKVDPSKRVVVVHCKAGKGRSGTMACSYLISQCGWKAEDALARFTERRMRPKFGTGVSIPSQLRWISYVDRWTRGGKTYVDREVEILEIHVWGLRHGVKVNVEGFVDEGKKIMVFHTFNKKERHVVQGDAPGGGGVMDFLGDALSPAADEEEVYEDVEYNDIVDGNGKSGSDVDSSTSTSSLPSRSQSKKSAAANLLRNKSVKKLAANPKSKTINPTDFAASASTGTSAATSDHNLPNPNASLPSLPRSNTLASNSEPGGMAVIFKPSSPIRLPTSDISVSLERRNRAPASMGLTMVTAVAHVWLNAFFEGRGPEQDGKADDSGVFDIEWEKMDGLKGSSRKGTKAADRISIVWRTVGSEAQGRLAGPPGVVVTEPGEGSPVPQMRAADWKGTDAEDPDRGRRLGLRAEDPGSECVSKASSVRSKEASTDRGSRSGKEDGVGRDSDDESLKGVKSAMPEGEEGPDATEESRSARTSTRDSDGGTGEGTTRSLSEHDKKVEATKGQTSNPDEASGAVKSQGQLAQNSSQNLGVGDVGLRGSAGEGPDQKTLPTSTGGDGTAIENARGDGTHTGDTTHLGFVKRGKKLLPMHTPKDGGSSNMGGTGQEEVGGQAEDPRVMTAHVQK